MRRSALARIGGPLLLLAAFLGAGAGSVGGSEDEAVETPAPTALDRTTYLERYLQTFPTRATAAGRHDLDAELERLDEESRRLWLAFNRGVIPGLERLLNDPGTDPTLRLDTERVLAEARRQLFELDVLRRPERDPLWWTGTIGNATVFLLVRDDRPEVERLGAAAARARQLPRLASEARRTLSASDPAEIAPELTALAARQAASTAAFYRAGFAAATDDPELSARLAEAGRLAADGIEELAEFLQELAERASGSPRLGDRYAPLFALVTGESRSPAEVLAAAETALVAKRREVADYGRRVWPQIFRWTEPPDDDRELVRRLFERVEADRCTSAGELVREYRRLIGLAKRFVRQNDIVTLPEPLTVTTDLSPEYFLGQGVGGVYPPGPFAPEADTLLFLPTPPASASEADRDRFFRGFNHHFNVMITPHEIVPGHALQLVYAARHPRKVRAIFADGVYVEGWGTFVERLMLDRGWGGRLARLAHLKKQLENIARTIVDIRVHTTGISEQEVMAFLRDEALQDEQLAANMWMRTLTSAPQLTSYYLGYEQVWGLYQDVRAARGDGFVLRQFMDGMMELGPVPVRHYRQRMGRQLVGRSPALSGQQSVLQSASEVRRVTAERRLPTDDRPPYHSGVFRSCFFSAFWRFFCSRLRLARFGTRVGLRSGSGARASRRVSARRSTASSRLAFCERWLCELMRSSAALVRRFASRSRSRSRCSSEMAWDASRSKITVTRVSVLLTC